MTETFNNARTQDTNSAPQPVPMFVPLDLLMYVADVVQPPITDDKPTRGLNHAIVYDDELDKGLFQKQLLFEYVTFMIPFSHILDQPFCRPYEC